MRIFLTSFSTLYTEKADLISDAVFPQRVHWFPETYTKTKSGLVQVPQRLLQLVMTPQIVEHVKSNQRPGERVGFILAGGSQVWGTGGAPLYEQNVNNSIAYAYKMEVLNVTNIFGARAAATFGAMDHVSTDASTCASSLKVLMDVRHLIQIYGFDRVVVLGMEDGVTNTVLNFFGSAKANICLDDERRGAVPSAFDKKHGGFYLGQGAALAVFESERAAARRKEGPRAELLGAYTAAEDYSNPLGQREDGQGYLRAIQGALELSGATPEGVGTIKTHGTGTEVNNRSERAAIEATFKDFVATSYKQRIGHTVGASGLLETCILLDDIKRGGKIPEIKNRTEEDTKFISGPTEAPRGLLLSLAAGMGNVYSAAIFNFYEYNKIQN